MQKQIFYMDFTSVLYNNTVKIFITILFVISLSCNNILSSSFASTCLALPSEMDDIMVAKKLEKQDRSMLFNEMRYLSHDISNVLTAFDFACANLNSPHCNTPGFKELGKIINEISQVVSDSEDVVYRNASLESFLSRLRSVTEKAHEQLDYSRIMPIIEEVIQLFISQGGQLSEPSDETNIRITSLLVYVKNTLADFFPDMHNPVKKVNLRMLVESSWYPICEGIRFDQVQRTFDIRDIDIKTDEVALTRALVNIFLNANDAIRRNKGTIHIETKLTEDNQYVEIIVSDTGDGIPSNILPHIFERHFTTKEFKRGGVLKRGMGLSIVKEYIENRCGGSIAVDSLTKDNSITAHEIRDRIRCNKRIEPGTTFTIRLPMKDSSSEPTVIEIVTKATETSQ